MGSNIVEVTIKVDFSKSVTLTRTCAKCGATARSTPITYDCGYVKDVTTIGKIFTVRGAMPPEGWEHIRGPNGVVDICPTCIAKFLGGV